MFSYDPRKFCMDCVRSSNAVCFTQLIMADDLTNCCLYSCVPLTSLLIKKGFILHQILFSFLIKCTFVRSEIYIYAGFELIPVKCPYLADVPCILILFEVTSK